MENLNITPQQSVLAHLKLEVRSFITDNFLFGQSGNFSDEDSFLENGLIDSMGILTLVDFVSEKYQISVADEEILPDNWDSVLRIANFVQSKSIEN
jgi:acyl carrier protein